MWIYAVAVLAFGFGYLAYLIKKHVFDYDVYLETWARSGKWFPTSEEEHLENSYLPEPACSIQPGPDRLIFCGGDNQGNLVSLGIERVSHNTAQVKACMWLQDGRKLETFEEAQELFPCKDWTSRDFSFQMMKPFDSWRIVINTIMKWRASSTPIYLHQTPQQQMFYSVEKRADTLWGHDQYGILSGTVSVDGVSTNIHYLSVKHRSWHSDRDIYVQSDHEQIFTLNFSKGSCIGHFHKCNKAFDVLKDSDIEYKEESQVQISICMPDASTRRYCLTREASISSVNVVDTQFCFNLNSLIGEDHQLKSIPPLCLIDIPPADHQLIVPLLDGQAMNSLTVGGKAANLAILKRIIDDAKHPLQISIPSGFCVTAEAYRQHLARNPTISNVLSQLDAMHEDDLESGCKELQCLWESSGLSKDLQEALSSHLHKDSVYAVRSSGIEEDLGSSSAAGQNESVLGVSGEEGVAHSILQCWTSLFSYQSVQYRRKNGLKVSSSEMCVLVQELVPEVLSAGVLFTCDPVSGHPWTSIVSCNYGLGLSVVGSTCDPDTFTLTRNVANDYKVKHKKCGNKANKTIFDGQEIQDVALSDEDNAAFSIQDQQAICLAEAGHEIRRIFGFECDIEWVLDKKSVLHIVQVRPVTSVLNWTDHELTHEFDSPIHEGYDAITFHNIGETCPGFVSPMTMVFMDLVDRTVSESMKSFVETNMILNNTIIYSYQGAIALFSTILIAEDEPVSQIIMCGQVVSTPEIHRLFLLRTGQHATSMKLKMIFTLFSNALRSDTLTKKTIALAESLTIPHSDDPNEMIGNIVEALGTCQLVGFYHCIGTGLSAVLQRIIIMIVVGNDLSNLSSDSLVQVANSIINSTNTVSVDITHQFKDIVASIVSEDTELQFLSVDSSDGVEWLKEHCDQSYQLLELFLAKFGHRGYKECDFTSETWSMNKPKVVEILQTLVQAKSEADAKVNSETKDATEIQDGAQLDRSAQIENSKILTLLLPFIRTVVARRELTKNALVLCVHKLRLAFIHLGSVMQCAGLLPHPRLIFFLTFYEVKQILTGHNGGVISKAIRRQKLSVHLDKVMFHAQSIGRPIPVNRDPKVLSVGKTLSGTAVWPGELVGIARVILDLAQASSITQGDILITHATDTGWTPYFSMLGGLVTELGGILSHGAVVAREYGLPCIVGVDDVTLYFRTGDRVLLNSTKGTIEKVVQAE